VLVQSAGELVTKTELMDRIWPGAIVNDNALRMHISAVRKVLGTYRTMLKTESGRGYRPLGAWTAQDQGRAAAAAPRTKALDSDLSLQAEALPAIAAICRQLDGIPLAIEFAAARAIVLGVHQVAAGLHDRFTLLTRGRRTALPRHQTLPRGLHPRCCRFCHDRYRALRAAFDWSYDLLPEEERLLLRSLAI
jgi:predicted ATPase